jgi:2-hydroxychromene-2-carboxylate isomerase
VGELIHLSERRSDRSRPSHAPSAFFFSLGCPISYLAAERVERSLGEIEWVPVVGLGLASVPDAGQGVGPAWADELLEAAVRAAAVLRVPLVVPDNYPADGRRAARAALYAAAQGAGPRFALSMARMVFCGGFDLDDPEVLGAAADAAGLEKRATLRAAADPKHDETLDATARGMHGRGITATPALRLDGLWREGLEAVPGYAPVPITAPVPLTPAG